MQTNGDSERERLQEEAAEEERRKLAKEEEEDRKRAEKERNRREAEAKDEQRRQEVAAEEVGSLARMLTWQRTLGSYARIQPLVSILFVRNGSS